MSDKKWYMMLDYQETKNIIQEKLEDLRRTFIAVGYYLRLVKDTKGYEEDGYKDIWEFAADQYGIQRSTASRWMDLNEKFSRDGNSPILAEQYRGFGKSQLQEMLYLDDSQIKEVTPDMTVREIRSIRKPENVSAYGTVKKVYPEGSPITTPGCEGGHDCFDCSEVCDIRQVDRYCRVAPLGNPFPCTTMKVLKNLGMDIGDSCQFINHDLAEHRAGDGEATPCCKNCTELCGYACHKAVEERAKRADDELADPLERDCPMPYTDDEEQEADAVCDVAQAGVENKPDKSVECPPGQGYCPRMEWGTEPDQKHKGSQECARCWTEYKKRNKAVGNVCATPHNDDIVIETTGIEVEPGSVSEGLYEELEELSDLDIAKRELEKMNELLVEMLGCYSEDDKRVRKQKVLIAALTVYICNLDGNQSLVSEQPELPILKNNDQRKDWLRNYREWGLWYEDEKVGVKYYRYTFEDGTQLIAEEYPSDYTDYTSYLHLVGGPQERPKNQFGCNKYPYHERYTRYPDSESDIVEFLKHIQKGMKK